VGFSSPAAEGTALATFEGDSADERVEEPGDLVVHRGHDEALVELVVCVVTDVHNSSRSLDICDPITVQRQSRRENNEVHGKIREQGAESDIQFVASSVRRRKQIPDRSRRLCRPQSSRCD